MTILGIKIYDKDISSVVDEIINGIKAGHKNNYVITATSAHGIIHAKGDLKFKNILNSTYQNIPDGLPLVWIGKLKGYKNVKRCYGPEFFQETISRTTNSNIRHFFCGGKEGVAQELKEACELKYGNKNIVGAYSPPFSEMNDQEIKSLANNINDMKTDILWIGLSTPKQEIFAQRLSQLTDVHFICTIGAAFDFHTYRLLQAPGFMQKMGLEWLFRLIVEPKRLWRRYLNVVPRFIFYNIQELLTGKFFVRR